MKTYAIICAFLAITANAGPLNRRQAAGDGQAAKDDGKQADANANAGEQQQADKTNSAEGAQKDENANAAGDKAKENNGQQAGQADVADDQAAAECNAAAGQEEAAAEGAAAGAAAGDAAAGAVVLPDGRIAQDAVPENFNVLASPFKSAVVKGDGLNFSDVITFPEIQPSIFDAAGNTKAFEININDQSIFVPEGQAPQDQFRRADLLPSIASTLNNVSTTGVKTMHFSLQQDPAKPLALATNEYQLAFLETADFESRIFDVRVGTGTTSASLTGENIVVLGRSGDAIQEMFVAPFSADLQNFAVTLDFDQNTMQVFHSTGQTPLAQVSEAVANDNSGNGEYHFALLKLADAQGQQAANIDEGMAFAGIFMEDSADGTVTLQ
ncbi:hypothetical protein F5883DRAFT_627357 [Diaporthe sp. PMI_573]|nr:hypothetical protein F5883DRAFT_627357 [Diaporthaceae sp. PMI_573]